MAAKQNLPKKKCIVCHQQGEAHVTINKKDYICTACMKKERQAMLTNPDHPAWKLYNLFAQALGIKAKTDD